MCAELQRKDPRLVRLGVLHGFGMRILLANARSAPLAYYARNNHKKKDPRVAFERSERLHGLEVQSECGFECD